MKFKDFKIGTKLSIGFGLITMITIILSITQSMTLNTLGSDASNLYHSADMADHIMEAKANMIKDQQIVMELLASESKNELNKWWQEHQSIVKQYDDNIDALITLCNDNSWGIQHNDDKLKVINEAKSLEKSHNETVLPLFNTLNSMSDKKFTINDSSELEQLADELHQHDEELDTKINNMLDKLEAIELIVAEIGNESELSSENNISKAKLNLIVFVVIGALLSLLFAIVIVRSITIPIGLALKLSKNIAQGDLMVQISIDQDDEVGELGKNLNAMTTKLKEIVTNVMVSANNISVASEELSGTSQQMSQGATEQAASTEEVSSSMEEMTSNIQQNTENAQETEKKSLGALQGVNKVGESSKQSLTSIKEIAEKITIINDIAFQTNILALNAAVEAARAGEHGKGFAVVAAEVRKLAERSKISADEIGVLSKSSVDVTEEAGKLMAELIPEIEKTASLVQEISSASIEQNSGANQINTSIQQLNNITQQNAAASEEMATSSEEMAAQANMLKELISFFKVDQQAIKTNTTHAKPSKARQSQKNNTIKPKTTGTKIDMMQSNQSDSDFENY